MVGNVEPDGLGEFRWYTFSEFRGRYPKVAQRQDLESVKKYDRIVGIFEDSTIYVGQFVLVVERRVKDEGEGNCYGWVRYPETRTRMSLGILNSDNTSMQGVLYVFEFDTNGRFATGRPSNPKSLEAGNLKTGIAITGLFREVTAKLGFSTAPELEILIGDEAVEKWFAEEDGTRSHDFDGLCKVLGRPNKAMQKEQAEKEEAERKRVLADMEESMQKLRESVRRAEELGLGKESIVQEVVALLASSQK